MSSNILLRNGTVLYHAEDDHVIPLYETDILIQENKIAKIGKDLFAPAKAQVIDCTGKIVSPGFIDTHHHLWQTQLKGRHAEQTLFEYMYTGRQKVVRFFVLIA